MKIPFLDLKRQYKVLQKPMEEAILAVLSSQQFVGGEAISDFERSFAKEHKLKHGIGVGNATDALLIVLKALNIGPGDEVIVPAHGWLSAAEMVEITGAKVVFVDVESENFGIDPDKVLAKISPKTKAIIAIHLYGQICQIEALSKISKEHGLHLIEDCAQAHFAKCSGYFAGHWGVASVFSFYPSKVLGAFGDAGAILTNDNDLALVCRKLANHGGLSKNEHQIIGLNSRLDTMQAKVLSVKLNFVKQWIEVRNGIADYYTRELKGIGDLILPVIAEGAQPNFHIYAIRTQQRDALKANLAQEGISTEIHYPLATPFTEAFNSFDYQAQDFPVSNQLQNELLSLPIYPELTSAELRYIVEQIRLFFH